MKALIKFTAFFLIPPFAFTSCKKEKAVIPPPIPPVVSAGIDQTIKLPTDSVQLNGSARDADGNIVSYTWSKVFGPPSFAIVNVNTALTNVKNLIEGMYVFELKVTDNAGLSAGDKVVVTVIDPANDPGIGSWDL